MIVSKRVMVQVRGALKLEVPLAVEGKLLVDTNVRAAGCGLRAAVRGHPWLLCVPPAGQTTATSARGGGRKG